MTETIIDGEAVDVTPTSAVVPVQQGVARFDEPTRDPLRALGRMTEAEYAEEVRAIIAGTNRMMALQRDLLREGVDYGTIPGTPKPTLYQPGAERLAMFHRLIPEHVVTETITPVPGHPDRIDVRSDCSLHLGSLEGPVIGGAKGAISSYEDRYRWRILQRTCPNCQQPTIGKNKAEWGGGWGCRAGKGGCGAKFPEGYKPIEDQPLGKVENDEPYALLNTLVQMAQKRAFVAAVRHALGITDLFTEEIEEGAGLPEADRPPQTAAAPADTASRPTTPPQAPPAQPAASRPLSGPPGMVTFEGPVMATPEGTRETATGRVLGFAIKVGRSKHNIDLWGDMALAALPHITEGTVIRVDGHLVEEDWPGRGDKPMKKVIKDVTTVWLGDRVIAQAKPQAPAAPSPVQQTMDAGPSPFDEDDPAWDPEAPAEPVKATGDPKASADVTGTIRRAAWAKTPQGADYVSLELVNGGVWYDVAMGKDDALATIAAAVGGPIDLNEGTEYRVIGGWSKSGALIIATMLMLAATVPA